MSEAGGPLQGLRVLEAGSWIAGPFGGSLLADFGAEVIKVESPGTGDPLRAANPNHALTGPDWSIEGRNKKSITLNLRAPQGQALFKELATVSDVLIENFRPGRLEQWGLAPVDLQENIPALVLVRVSGYGQDGPYRDRPAFDHVALAMSGLAHISGQPDGPLTKPGIVLADYMSGIFAALAALMGVYRRQRSGDGDIVDVAMYEGLFRLLKALLAAWIAQQSSGQLLTALEDADIPASLVHDIETIYADPHFQARETIVAVENEDGHLLNMQAVIPKFSRSPGRIRHSGPRLGEHSAAIYCDLLGHDRQELITWQQQGII